MIGTGECHSWAVGHEGLAGAAAPVTGMGVVFHLAASWALIADPVAGISGYAQNGESHQGDQEFHRGFYWLPLALVPAGAVLGHFFDRMANAGLAVFLEETWVLLAEALHPLVKFAVCR